MQSFKSAEASLKESDGDDQKGGDKGTVMVPPPSTEASDEGPRGMAFDQSASSPAAAAATPSGLWPGISFLEAQASQMGRPGVTSSSPSLLGGPNPGYAASEGSHHPPSALVGESFEISKGSGVRGSPVRVWP